MPLSLEAASQAELVALERELSGRHLAHCRAGHALDLTRGKPSAAQLDLAAGLDDVAYLASDGTDVRNYGAPDGIPEMKALAAEILGVEPDEVVVGGNSSLAMMYHVVLWAYLFGPDGEPGGAWSRVSGGPRFLCPVPGYDRHFTVCEQLGIDMVNVPLTPDGPDMDRVEALIDGDSRIRGMWCVPRFSNPGAEVYSAETVQRVARLGRRASPGFRVLWDNAYAVHDLADEPGTGLASLLETARAVGTEDSVVLFGSTSKVTRAGAGVAFMAGSRRTLDAYRSRVAAMTIGEDKVNQLRHARFLKDLAGVRAHMRRHAEILRPKFEAVERHLEEGLGDAGLGEWTRPQGGYFVSFFTRPGVAARVVALAADAGVKLTPAGSAYPYRRDPEDRHIRLAPTFPPLPELEAALEVFVDCVKLASVRQRLGTNA